MISNEIEEMHSIQLIIFYLCGCIYKRQRGSKKNSNKIALHLNIFPLNLEYILYVPKLKHKLIP